jgi:hypothetical protein
MRQAFLVLVLDLVIGNNGRAEQPRLQRTLIGHKGSVNDVTFAPFWPVLASASEDGTVKLWDLTTSKNTATFVHPAPVLSVAFDNSGLRLIAGCRDGTVKVWSLMTGKNTATIHVELPARHVGFCGSVLDALLGDDHVVVVYPAEKKPIDGDDIWDLKTGKKIPVVINCNSVNLDVSAGSEKGWAIANVEPHYPDYPITTGEISFTPTTRDGAARFPIALRGHTGRVTSLAFSPQGGKWLVSGSLDKTIKIWRPATAKCVATLTDHAGPVYSVEFSRDGKRLVSGSADGTIKLWKMPEE